MKDLLLFDFETGSNVPETTGVVQIGAVRKHADKDLPDIEIFNQLCKPSVPMSEKAIEVHGITPDKVVDAEPDDIAVKRLHLFVKDTGVILAGHNIVGFDMPILWRIGGEVLPVLWIDTLVCATRVYPEAESHKLSDLVEWLKLGSVENAHDAMADIRMVGALIDHFKTGLMKPSYEDMAEWCMTPRILKRAHFGKHKGKLWGRPENGEPASRYVPYWYIKFITDKFTNVTPDMKATIKAKYNMRFKG